MAIQTTYTQARAKLKELFDHSTDTREAVIIHRRNGEDMALLPLKELSGLIETIHVLRSPNNARRLYRALERAQKGKGKRLTVEQLRAEFGLEKE